MNKHHVVVTGARSFAGNQLARHLAARNDVELTEIISDRRPVAEKSIEEPVSGTRFAADLTSALPNEIKGRLRAADRVYHFAWDRSVDEDTCYEKNDAMVTNLLEAVTDPRRIVFVSTISAGSRAPSIYGNVKFAMEEKIRTAGGSVLVVGLITDRQAGAAYRTICNVVCRLPLRYVFSTSFLFFPVSLRRFVACGSALLENSEPGTYGAFSAGGVPAQTFLGDIEQQCPRFRLPFPVPVELILLSLRAMTPLGGLLARPREKLATFLYRDSSRLLQMKSIG